MTRKRKFVCFHGSSNGLWMLDRIVFGNKYVLCTEYQLSMKGLNEFLDQQYFIENELAVVTKHLKIGAQVLVLEIS